jgi:hypothetical protein
MERWFQLTTLALVEVLLPTLARPVPAAAVQECTAFIASQRRRMPDTLRGPLLLATLLFDAWPVVAGYWKPFHRLSLEQRRQQVGVWKASRLSFCRDLLRFHESLAVFCLFSLLEITPVGGQAHAG